MRVPRPLVFTQDKLDAESAPGAREGEITLTLTRVGRSAELETDGKRQSLSLGEIRRLHRWCGLMLGQYAPKVNR